MWFTCEDLGRSPAIFSSTVTVPEPVVIVIVPLAVVPMPLSGNINGARVGVGVGDGVAMGVMPTLGDGEESVPVDPQAAVIKTTAVSATNLLNLEFPDHLCPPALPLKVT
jgi:hypothetical protein